MGQRPMGMGSRKTKPSNNSYDYNNSLDTSQQRMGFGNILPGSAGKVSPMLGTQQESKKQAVTQQVVKKEAAKVEAPKETVKVEVPKEEPTVTVKAKKYAIAEHDLGSQAPGCPGFQKDDYAEVIEEEGEWLHVILLRTGEEGFVPTAFFNQENVPPPSETNSDFGVGAASEEFNNTEGFKQAR